MNDFDGKKLKFKTFKLKLAYLSNKIDESLFEQIFNHKIKTLANKLINTIKKEKKIKLLLKILKKKTKMNFLKLISMVIG